MDRPYPLVDVLHCGHCKTRLSTHYVDRGKWKVPYYRCTQTFKKTWSACPIKQVNADKIEAKLLDLLEELSLSPELVRQAVEAANTTSGEQETALKETEYALKARLGELSAPIANLVEVLKAGGATALGSAVRQGSWSGSRARRRWRSTTWREVQQQFHDMRRGTYRPRSPPAEVIRDLRLLLRRSGARRTTRADTAPLHQAHHLLRTEQNLWASSSSMGERFTFRSPVRNYKPSGSDSRTRTLDPAVNSRLLYQLS